MADDRPRCTICGDFDGDLHNVPVVVSTHKFTTEGQREMFRVTVTDTLQRSTEVALTTEQYNALHQSEDQIAQESAIRVMLDEAQRLRSDENLEWVCTVATDEEDEEVFDV